MSANPVINVDTQALVIGYESGLSAQQLATRHHCSINTVLRRLVRAGVKVRSPRESHPVYRLNLPPEKRQQLREIVDGILLGDGYLAPDGCLYLGQCVRRQGWLQQVQSMLSDISVPSRVIRVKDRKEPPIWEGRLIKGKGSHLLYTKRAAEFREERTRWYLEGVKVVPRDLRLTAITLAMWFAGDGSYSTNGRLSFCTNGFLITDVEWLVGSLQAIGIHCHLGKADGLPIIRVDRRDDAVRLCNAFEAFLPECMLYKTQYVRPAIPRGRALRRLTEGQVREIRQRHLAGDSYTSLGKQYGVSNVAITNIVHRKVYKDVV
jgi:hypothetical protein